MTIQLNTAQSIIALLSRTKTAPLTLDEGVTIQIKSLSLAALEDLQAQIKALEGKDEDPRMQFLPILKGAVQGLEEATPADIGGFLLEDLNKIATRVMEVGK